MTNLTPAQELRAAVTALRDPDADACQHPDCGCPDELHRRDADGASWCRDCDDQHPYRPAPAFAIPEQLRGPLADWLDSLTGVEVSEHGPMVEEYQHALAVARALLGGDQ